MITAVKAAAKLSPFHPEGASLGVAESSVDAVAIPKYQQLPLVDQVRISTHRIMPLVSGRYSMPMRNAYVWTGI